MATGEKAENIVIETIFNEIIKQLSGRYFKNNRCYYDNYNCIKLQEDYDSAIGLQEISGYLSRVGEIRMVMTKYTKDGIFTNVSHKLMSINTINSEYFEISKEAFERLTQDIRKIIG